MRVFIKFIVSMACVALLHAANIVGVGRDQDIAYTVKKGDTLWKISQRFYGTGFRAPQLQKHNDLRSDFIEVGQKLSVPALHLRLMVASGDSLSKISEAYFCGVSRYKVLADYNKIPAPYRIKEGQILRLPLYSYANLLPCDQLILRGGGIVDPNFRTGKASVESIVSCDSIKTNECVTRLSPATKTSEPIKTTTKNKTVTPLTAPKTPTLNKQSISAQIPIVKTVTPKIKTVQTPLVKEQTTPTKPVPPVQKPILTKEPAQSVKENISPPTKAVATESDTWILDKKLAIWQKHTGYDRYNSYQFAASVDFMNYRPKRPVINPTSTGLRRSVMPVYRLSHGIGRGDVSAIFANWDSSSTDAIASLYRNKYSLSGATVSISELLDNRVGFQAEVGLVEYKHEVTISNSTLFGTVGSTARNMSYVFSTSLIYHITNGLDLSLSWMRFSGHFKHQTLAVETDMGSSAFGFGIHYRF